MSRYENPLEEIRGILEKTTVQDVDPELTSRLTKNSSISSEKMLINYSSDSPRIFHTTLKDIKDAQIAVETKLSDGFTKALPVMLIIIIVMGAVVGVSQLPQIIDSVTRSDHAAKLNDAKIAALTADTTVSTTEVKIVYLTPAEAAAQGISVENAPSGIVPDILDRDQAPIVNSTGLNPVPEDVTVSEAEVTGNQRTEGFDILGNLSPKIIPFNAGNTAKSQKTCEDGFTRNWIKSSIVPNNILTDSDYTTSRDKTSLWLCLTPNGLGDSYNEETEILLEEDIGTYMAR